KLPDDMGSSCANRPADTDLLRAFGDRYQHDVHDADPTNQQRYADKRNDDHRDGKQHRVEALDDSAWCIDDKTIRLLRRHMTPAAQELGRLVNHLIEFARFRSQHDRVIVLTGKHVMHDAVGDEDEAVGGRSAKGHFRLIESADDSSNLVSDLNLFAEWIVAAQEP